MNSCLPSLERSTNILPVKNHIILISKKFHDESGISIKVPDNHHDNMVAAINNQSGETITYGCGKGVDYHIGAFGECIEHLHLWLTAQRIESVHVPVKLSMLYDDDIFIRHSINYLSKEDSCYAIPFIEMGEGQIRYIPTELVNVFYTPVKNRGNNDDYTKFLRRYASSSGTAFGFSREDAILHAMLEIIERHEISNLFLSIIGFHSSDKPYTCISNYSFSNEINEVSIRVASNTITKKVESLILETEFGAFFSFTIAEVKTSREIKRIWGAGCSLYRDLAIYRSVAECEQMMLSEHKEYFDKIKPLSQKYHVFRKIANLDLSNITISHNDLEKNENHKPMKIDEQIDFLNSKIKSSKRAVLYYEHEALLLNYNVVTVYISQMEKFFGISHSLPVLPISHIKNHEDNLGN
ncbi:YcaO-like family protein [Klebsiella pneumoniae]|uniref:YcaO-like family protein n=2 Tax=Klebsiella pneumoniae TaxID=573 RepID=UPI00190FE611|nr:YcaO-like family protein [Klebsiella pneumoniae]